MSKSYRFCSFRSCLRDKSQHCTARVGLRDTDWKKKNCFSCAQGSGLESTAARTLTGLDQVTRGGSAGSTAGSVCIQVLLLFFIVGRIWEQQRLKPLKLNCSVFTCCRRRRRFGLVAVRNHACGNDSLASWSSRARTETKNSCPWNVGGSSAQRCSKPASSKIPSLCHALVQTGVFPSSGDEATATEAVEPF